MERPDVIRINNVAKKFVVHKDKSLKERIVNAARSRKHREEYWALDGVSLTIKAGESVGLAGANGSGKSTLLKIIGGILTPDRGDVQIRGRVAALLELGAGFHPDLTGRENVFLNGAILGLSEEEIAAKFDSIVEFSGIADFIDTQVKFYSSGMYVRLAFAVAVHSDPDILLVDEVLAVGDEPFQRKCMEKIHEFQAEGRSIILVSHSADQIIDICDRAVVLDGGKIAASGEARDAMTFLHKKYQEDMAAQSSVDMYRMGTIKGAEIIEGLSTNDGAVPVFVPGNDLKVAIDIHTNEPLKGHAVLLDLETDRGRHVLGVDSRRFAALPELNGDGRVVFTIPALQVGQGDFTFTATFLDPAGFEMDSIRHCVLLPVRSSRPTIGVLSAEASVNFTEL